MLRDTEIKAFKPAEKPYKKSDGGGLFLLVETNGSKLWRLSYRFHGKQKTLSGGPYPIVSLVAARQWREEARTKLASGVDPSAARKEEKRRARSSQANTFEEIGREWHEARKEQWSERYAALVLSRLVDDIFPVIGHLPIAEIDGPILLDALRAIESRGALEMAHRVRNHCGEVFRYAIADGKARRDPSADIAAALKRPPPTEHRAKILPAAMPDFFRRLAADESDPVTHLALRWTILTMVRTQETRFAQWTEFEELEGKHPLWRISAERMKMANEHLVPLSKQAVAMLREIRKFSGKSKYLFPVGGSKKGVISENRMLYCLYRLGYHSKATVHGFRGTASTALNESTLFESDWIERQLAHVEGNKVRGAYNSAKWLKERRVIVQWWADQLDAWEAQPVDEFDEVLG